MDYQDFTDACTKNLYDALSLELTQFDSSFFEPCNSCYHCIVRVYLTSIDIDLLIILKQAFTDFTPTILISTGAEFFDFDFLLYIKDSNGSNLNL